MAKNCNDGALARAYEIRKIQKVSESVSVLSKMQEYEICFSGFPKKACQGSLISVSQKGPTIF